MPPSFKKYVTLDLLNVTLTGSGKGSINGDYDGCLDAANWDGSGTLAAEVEVGGELKIKTPGKVIVIQGSVKGETGISEEITVESPNFVLSGKWDGLAVKGEVEIIVSSLFTIKKSVSKSILDEKVVPQTTITLPTLN